MASPSAARTKVQALNVQKDSPKVGKTRKYSMLLAEVPVTLA